MEKSILCLGILSNTPFCLILLLDKFTVNKFPSRRNASLRQVRWVGTQKNLHFFFTFNYFIDDNKNKKTQQKLPLFPLIRQNATEIRTEFKLFVYIYKQNKKLEINKKLK